MLAAPRGELVHETTGNTDFTDESNTCGSSVADIPWSLFGQRIIQSNITMQDSYVYKNVLARTNSNANILSGVEKADRVDFLEEDCSTSTGFHDD